MEVSHLCGLSTQLCALWVVLPELGAPMARRGCSQNPRPLTINPCLDLHLPYSLIERPLVLSALQWRK